MILGVGTDIIDIRRIRSAAERERFLTRYYTEKEILACKGSAASLAGNFAVKEAVAKALGTGFHLFFPRDIEVLRNKEGKPMVKLHEGAAEVFSRMGGRNLQVSISHEANYAVAFVVVEGE